MKKINFTLPMLAVLFGLVALVGTAATDRIQTQNQTDVFWTFTGTDPTDPGDYSQEGIPSDCQDHDLALCGISAPDDGGQPDLSELEADLDPDQSQIDYTNGKIYAGPRTQ
ncbi:hypothetical protein EDD80_10598 [Anseongella ginsenosidimutans]|uniref:Uncharacterized protein n=1 Tax=Anseongella ginsenosidimutans TaxID=496056 RepID=A0A4R3KRH7_9SPHI|nr:hypothetical protein [Anseongella ginsenosidimutans]QEC52894.1 hypothetical protein FRZ59_11485 [Anseongella ginsenosidimutans]TCS87284.1 hypothetical protein EDD80_10598 [Anseongella ginsenosidimutans]